MKKNLLNDARPDWSAYETIAETFPNTPLLPQLRHLVYLVPDVDENMGWELVLCLELKSLLMPSLIAFSLEEEGRKSDIILETVASTCREIRALEWKRPQFMTHLPHSLSRFLMLRTSVATAQTV